MKRGAIFIAGLGVFLAMLLELPAQIPIPPPVAGAAWRSSADLDQMLAPIALYPDPLIAIILPAATLPSEVVVADRYVRQGGDMYQVDLQPWDPSIKALARYPEVLRWMDDNITWTTDVGQAFLNQQVEVMNSIQRLRAQALSLGNLQSTAQQRVITDNGTIEIVPANPQIVYVPVYQPEVVYVQRPPRPGFFVSFGLGLGVGAWLDHDLDWRDHRIVVWNREHPRPSDWWYRPPSRRETIIHNNVTVINRQEPSVWHPRERPPMSGANRGDRGWEPALLPPIHPKDFLPPIHPKDLLPPVTARPELPHVPAPHREEVGRGRSSGGALIGVQSSHETQQYQARGQQSRQGIVSRPTAPRQVAPASPSHTPSASPERNRR